ncbi:DUF4030 domain-containing protein [Bacillus sp. FJAT-29790]|uniref:DUF4030 domain-containing protein n=1 Tax=Bacillus sp. FJAT-29790 TaxID=1895002 RepID=UPI001C21628C|nr:DUF4030 domain-containing protein [Bacillus sp. FJAT-29790]MBU8880088.1 DUF4030 domain-containing protein [Bacillus sp. FJAT-29790]
MKIDESLKKDIEEEMEKIQVPSSMYEFSKNIKGESKKRGDFEKPTRRNRGWRKSQFVVAAVISLVILTGSAFLNPTMAEVVSKIPYLGQVFHKPIQEVIAETLEKEGYKPAGIGMGMWGQKPLFDIRLKGTKEYVNQEEDKVLNILTEVLEKRGYDNYELMVSDTNEGSPALNEIEKQREELGEKLMRDLQIAGYPIMNINAYSHVVKVYIPIADEAKKVEIYKAAIELLKANGSPKQVQIITRDVSEEELESQWMPAMIRIEEEFYLKKEYRVADISYSYKPEKVSITIMTSMKSSDAEAKETVTKIRKEITEYLDSEEGKTKTEKQKYDLIVQDKNGNDFPF